MAATGRLVFYWSSFEQALAHAIAEAHQLLLNEEPEPVRGGLVDRLDLWRELMLRLPGSAEHASTVDALRDQALQLREIRNLIVHGVVSGHARPDNGEPAHISCTVGGFEKPTGEVRRITLEELEHFVEAIDACRRGCEDPRRFNYRL